MTSRLRHIAPGESGDSLGSARSFRCPPRWSVLSRSGFLCSDDCLTKMQPWVDQWEHADEHLVHPIGPHTDSSFRAYLTWYLPRTRARLVYVDTHPQPHQARSQDGYARHHVEALARFAFAT
ncbi:hypothetical protein PVAP13_8KG133401 [Panicum virgatum]|uniref:Uncharacterized protein n=1 Tax=Panicum virgatum TaxID=38727 RepID=A0A8T0PGE8_PANVG|nr:hypothetical protein PVAP13_8KG133401 [Panicum virgatum]